ncbi:hypothetical protein F3Y22_tig00014949pilonHSYRG00046 [Hibiscus syriacus]|uniref:Uncharacterized protein n=1 Tax=Hibiscus syriacus TaxID=106335 RepID=A0A6A3BYT9_HIBSY|nr:hypothetical protein F3Y22_tig00014949pilonHSYRG00046 [Hibiscus syriacus]
MWYGDCGKEIKNTMRNFIKSLNFVGGSPKLKPKVASWWKWSKVTNLDAECKARRSESLSGHRGARDITIQGVCYGRCSFCFHTEPPNPQTYIVVGNPEFECPEECIWPFHATNMPPRDRCLNHRMVIWQPMRWSFLRIRIVAFSAVAPPRETPAWFKPIPKLVGIITSVVLSLLVVPIDFKYHITCIQIPRSRQAFPTLSKVDTLSRAWNPPKLWNVGNVKSINHSTDGPIDFVKPWIPPKVDTLIVSDVPYHTIGSILAEST